MRCAFLVLALCGQAVLPAWPAGDPYAPAAVSNHLATLKKTAGPGFTVLWEPPFAVAGDPDAATVRSISSNTIRWAATRLKAAYFPRDPREIIDIWLFRDDVSYRQHARALFHDSPDTPFGYYSPSHRALVMNIATGTGTLVHEMVHPLMSANFPECPAWFNEGLASLYEQCGERSGRIVGYPNWRLPALQEDIRAGKVPSFRKLTATTTDEFYGRTTGTSYSGQYGQARYLCYYLQEHGLLGQFYREFRASAASDPTGYTALRKILGEKDMAAFQKKWEAETLQLRFAAN